MKLIKPLYQLNLGEIKHNVNHVEPNLGHNLFGELKANINLFGLNQIKNQADELEPKVY